MIKEQRRGVFAVISANIVFPIVGAYNSRHFLLADGPYTGGHAVAIHLITFQYKK